MEQLQIASTKEVAELLGISEATVDRWRRKGVIPSRKIGGKRIYLRNEIIDILKAEPCSKSA